MRKLLSTTVMATVLGAVALVGGAAGPKPASAAPAAVGSWCTVTPWGGIFECTYSMKVHTFSNGVVQVWVIGTDWAVWTKWMYPNGQMTDWQSMGGIAYHGQAHIVSGDFALCKPPEVYSGSVALRLRGQNGSWYYNSRPPSGYWTGWREGWLCYGA
jgi:hypothetical protein